MKEKNSFAFLSQKDSFLGVLAALIYAGGQIFLGLLLHPYRSMQLIVRGKVFLPLAFSPLIFMLLLALLTKTTGFWSLYTTVFLFRFLFSLLFFFCFYWQLMLVYLLLRFTRVFWRTRAKKSSP